jgi:hypothetical protein
MPLPGPLFSPELEYSHKAKAVRAAIRKAGARLFLPAALQPLASVALTFFSWAFVDSLMTE